MLFDFTVSRHRDGPELFFDNYRGTLLGDCWHGFGSIAAASQGEILRAACNSHARRKFEDATLACVEAGLPVVRGKKAISLERQVRIAAGSLVLLGAALYFVHPAFIGYRRSWEPG